MKSRDTDKALRDLFIVAIIATLAFPLAKILNVYEVLYGVTQEYEAWDLGRVIVVFVILPLPITVFALRRWRELRAAIAERDRAEEALRESEEKYRLIFENAWEGISVHETLPDGTRKLVDCNPQYVEMSGRSREELLRMGDTRKLQESRISPREEARVQERAAQLRPHRGAYSWLRPDESGNYVEYTSAYYQVRGKTFAIGIDHDVTERKHAEAALIHAERIAAVGTLASGVAHEFNNIHGVVLGYLDLILTGKDLPAEIREDLELVRQSAARGTAVTRNLLSFAHGGKALRARTSLKPLVESTLKIIGHQFQTEGIEVTARGGEDVAVTADAGQIGQVIMNLFINARHSLMGCPVRKLEVEVGRRGDRAFVRVADTGCGIPADRLGKIFLPFFSTKGEHAEAGSPQSEVKGTGLGLSVCDTIIKEHGGQIAVESRPGEGATFTVWLPAAAGRPADAGPQGPVRSVPGARVLVLDDEAEMRELLARMLETMEYEVVASDDGAEALGLLAGKPFDLVMVDLQMPKMSGAEFLRRMNRTPPERRPASLVITGRYSDAAAEGYADLGVFDTIQKPFTSGRLYERVYAALSAKQGR